MPPRNLAPFRVVAYPRQTFVRDVFTYRAGQHLSIIAPTEGGKTTLAYELLDATATKDLPALVAVMKPQDDTIDAFTRRTKFRIVHDWPAPPSVMRPGKQRGYVVWPTFTEDLDGDDVRHAAIFQRMLRKSYLKGDRIVFADEVFSLQNEYGLRRDLDRVWTKGRSMRCGLWGATQMPAFVSGHMYSQAEHLFLGHDPDERRRDRFGEIGGLDPKRIEAIVEQLPRFQFLYIRRGDRTMCIVLDR
jgi:hypothetical protein